jgi:5S rRNA maturation endonuclease (ribonuclease M5)
LDIRKKLENFLELLTELQNENLTVPIIVEGEKDELALRAFGFKGEIIRLHSGKSILNLCEEISREYSEVIIFTDWDKRGVRFYNKLRKLLMANGIKYNDKFWKIFRNICSKDIQDVEDLPKYVENLKKQVEKN